MVNDLNRRYEKSVDFVLKNLQDEVKNNQDYTKLTKEELDLLLK